jgi:hypothetical protein
MFFASDRDAAPPPARTHPPTPLAPGMFSNTGTAWGPTIGHPRRADLTPNTLSMLCTSARHDLGGHMDAASPLIRTTAIQTALRRSTYRPWSVADATAMACRHGIPIGDVLLIAVSACGIRSVYDRDHARVVLRLCRPAGPVRAVVVAALNATQSPFALRHDELSLDGEVIGHIEHLAIEHPAAEHPAVEDVTSLYRPGRPCDDVRHQDLKSLAAGSVADLTADRRHQQRTAGMPWHI